MSYILASKSRQTFEMPRTWTGEDAMKRLRDADGITIHFIVDELRSRKGERWPNIATSLITIGKVLAEVEDMKQLGILDRAKWQKLKTLNKDWNNFSDNVAFAGIALYNAIHYRQDELGHITDYIMAQKFEAFLDRNPDDDYATIMKSPISDPTQGIKRPHDYETIVEHHAREAKRRAMEAVKNPDMARQIRDLNDQVANLVAQNESLTSQNETIRRDLDLAEDHVAYVLGGARAMLGGKEQHAHELLTALEDQRHEDAVVAATICLADVKHKKRIILHLMVHSRLHVARLSESKQSPEAASVAIARHKKSVQEKQAWLSEDLHDFNYWEQEDITPDVVGTLWEDDIE